MTSFNLAITVCKKRQQPEGALALRQQCKGWTRAQCDHIQRDCKHIREGQQPERTLALLSVMLGAGSEPNEITDNAKISVCGDGRIARAELVYNVITYSAAISAFVKGTI